MQLNLSQSGSMGCYWSLKVIAVLMSIIIVTDSAINDSATNSKKSGSEPDVPLLFPNDSNRYKIISNNSSLLEKFLVHTTNMSSPEIVDMLNIQEFKDSPRMVEMERILKDPPVEKHDEKPSDDEHPDLESEILQEKGADVEKDSLISHKVHLGLLDKNIHKMSIGKWIAMSAAILLTLAATVYISMLLWKKSLEKRYGSRQILVEEEEAHEEYKHSMV